MATKKSSPSGQASKSQEAAIKAQPVKHEANAKARAQADSGGPVKVAGVQPAAVPVAAAPSSFVPMLAGPVPLRTEDQVRKTQDLLASRQQKALKEQKDLQDKEAHEAQEARRAKTEKEGGLRKLSQEESFTIDNPSDQYLEVEVAGESYVIGPGENEIISRHPRLSSKAIAEFIHGKLASLGATFRQSGGEAPRKAAGEGSARSTAETVEDIMENTPTGGALAVPEVLKDEIAYTSNPGMEERAQPERFQESGPQDPDGSAARERKRKMIQMHVTGKKIDEPNQDGPRKAKEAGPSPSPSKVLGGVSEGRRGR